MGLFDKFFGGKEDKTLSKEEKQAAAEQLHQEARQLGAQAKYDLAIKKLTKANELTPDWAYPVYDMAFTYLLKQDFANSLKYYALTNKMEPKGFFSAKTAQWSLQKEKKGTFPQGLYLAFMQIEWRESDEEKLQIANNILDKYPKYAPAWETIASKGDNPADRMVAVENGLALDPDLNTRGSLLVNKALIFSITDKKEEAKTVLQELIVDETATTQSVAMANFVLSTLK